MMPYQDPNNPEKSPNKEYEAFNKYSQDDFQPSAPPTYPPPYPPPWTPSNVQGVPVVQPMVQPMIQPMIQPGVQPMWQPGVQPMIQPGVQPMWQPGVQPMIQPGVQPMIQPGVQPMVQPGVVQVFQGEQIEEQKPIPCSLLWKVYSVLVGQVIVTEVCFGIFAIEVVRDWTQYNFWILFPVSLVIFLFFFVLLGLLAYFKSIKQTFPWNLICILIFSVALGVMFGTQMSHYGGGGILIGVGICLCVAVVLLLMSCFFKIYPKLMLGWLCSVILSFVVGVISIGLSIQHDYFGLIVALMFGAMVFATYIAFFLHKTLGLPLMITFKFNIGPWLRSGRGMCRCYQPHCYRCRHHHGMFMRMHRRFSRDRSPPPGTEIGAFSEDFMNRERSGGMSSAMNMEDEIERMRSDDEPQWVRDLER